MLLAEEPSKTWRLFGRAKCQKIYLKPHLSGLQGTQSSTLVIYRRDAKSGVWWTAIEQMQEVVLPVLVIVVGIFCSIASLTSHDPVIMFNMF